MRYYSDLEIDLLIEEIREAANEAIEQAAAEAARAAFLASLEREALLLQARALALREATYQQANAQRWRVEAQSNFQAIAQVRRTGTRNAIITGIVCFAGGLVVGFLVR